MGETTLYIVTPGTGISIQCTNRDTVYDLYGSSTAIGLSKNAYKWLSIGGDLIYFSDISDMSNSQQSAQGLQICIGLGVGMDTHIIKSTTKKMDMTSTGKGVGNLAQKCVYTIKSSIIGRAVTGSVKNN